MVGLPPEKLPAAMPPSEKPCFSEGGKHCPSCERILSKTCLVAVHFPTGKSSTTCPENKGKYPNCDDNKLERDSNPLPL